MTQLGRSETNFLNRQTLTIFFRRTNQCENMPISVSLNNDRSYRTPYLTVKCLKLITAVPSTVTFSLRERCSDVSEQSVCLSLSDSVLFCLSVCLSVSLSLSLSLSLSPSPFSRFQIKGIHLSDQFELNNCNTRVCCLQL